MSSKERKSPIEFNFHLFFTHKIEDQEVVEHIEAPKKAELFEKLSSFQKPNIIGLVKGRLLPLKQKVVYKI